MKSRFFLVVAAIFGLSFGAKAQLVIKPTIGVTVTDFSKSADGTAKGKAGVLFGGTVAYGQKFYIESGLLYAVKNTEYTYSTNSNAKVSQDFQLKGLRVPLNVGVNLLGNSDSFIGLRVFGGPTAFYVLSTGKDVNVSDLKRFNFGLQAGAGLDIWKFFVESSYEWSMTNVQKDINSIDLGKHRSIYVQAGLRFNL